MSKIKTMILKPIRKGRVGRIRIENEIKDDCLCVKQDDDIIFLEKRNVAEFVKLLNDIIK